MQLESLKVFCDVARYRSFSQAALANSVSQSAASQAVSQIERRMKAQLIDRSTRPLQLTALGQVYYEGCKELLTRYLDLEAQILTGQARLATHVEVAAIYSVGLGDMGKYVEQFRTEQPGCHVHIEYLHPDRVIEKVLDGTVDFGLVSFPRPTRELDALPWRDEEMVLVCAPGHPLAQLRTIRPGLIEGQPYIAFDRDLRIRRQVDRFLRECEVNVEIVLEYDNIEQIKKAIEIDAGVALLPEPTLRREVRDGTLVAVPLAGGRFVRPLGIIQRRHHHLSAAARQFLELLRRPEPVESLHGDPAHFATDRGQFARRPKHGHRRRNGAASASK